MLGITLLVAAKKKLGSRRIYGGLRVFAYGLAVCAGLAVYSYRSAKADIGKSSMEIGRDLAQVKDLLEETTEIHLNGQPVFVASAVAKEPMDQVLDRFEQHCNSSPGALGDAWKELAKLDSKNDLKDLSKKPISNLGVVRQQQRGEGVVLCLIKGTETPNTFADAARAFTKTHNLGTFGKLRYAYARTTSSGETLVLTVWTEDRFQLDAMFPAEGDAPGKDPEGIPRPPDSRRLMSIDVQNTPFGTHVYRSTSSPEQLLKYYDADMDTKGWLIVDPPEGKGLGHGYIKDGVQYMVATGRDETGATVVSIGEMAATARQND